MSYSSWPQIKVEAQTQSSPPCIHVFMKQVFKKPKQAPETSSKSANTNQERYELLGEQLIR